jgi:hypothetical protein
VDTACYYLFSTVSQTLAGAFGFLVAMVLYQMQTATQGLGNRINERTVNLQIPDPATFKLALAESNWSLVCSLLKDAPVKPLYLSLHKQEEGSLVKLRDELYNELFKIACIQISLRRCMHWTGSTIMASLAALALTPLIASKGYVAFPAFFLLANVSAACYCLWTFYPLVRNVTK